jgi:hypothetical protein
MANEWRVANRAVRWYSLLNIRYPLTMTYDPRTTPARPDLAALHLKGQVEAARRRIPGGVLGATGYLPSATRRGDRR